MNREEASLAYAADLGPLQQSLELSLTHTSLGLYVEATMTVVASLTPKVEGEAMQVAWSIGSVEGLSLAGTVEEGETQALGALLGSKGKGLDIGDLHGVVDVGATDAAAPNVERAEATADSPPATRLVLDVVGQQLRLPRLPTETLKLDQPVEVEEEIETVVTEDLVLPTTTLHRFTLRGVDEAGVAEIAIQRASVAEALPPDPEEEVEEPEPKKKKGKGKKGKRAGEPEEPEPLTAQMEIRDEGTLLFDVVAGMPLSLELTRTERYVIGDQEVERSITARSTYRRP